MLWGDIGALLITCATAVQAAAQATVEPVGIMYAAVLKQHQPAQVIVEALQGKHVETVFVVREKPLHRAQVIVEGHQALHAALLIIGIVMTRQAALVQVRTGAELIVRQALALLAAAHSNGTVMILQVVLVQAETGVELTAAAIHALHVLQLNTGTAILNQHAQVWEKIGANQVAGQAVVGVKAIPVRSVAALI